MATRNPILDEQAEGALAHDSAASGSPKTEIDLKESLPKKETVGRGESVTVDDEGTEDGRGGAIRETPTTSSPKGAAARGSNTGEKARERKEQTEIERLQKEIGELEAKIKESATNLLTRDPKWTKEYIDKAKIEEIITKIGELRDHEGEASEEERKKINDAIKTLHELAKSLASAQRQQENKITEDREIPESMLKSLLAWISKARPYASRSSGKRGEEKKREGDGGGGSEKVSRVQIPPAARKRKIDAIKKKGLVIAEPGIKDSEGFVLTFYDLLHIPLKGAHLDHTVPYEHKYEIVLAVVARLNSKDALSPGKDALSPDEERLLSVLKEKSFVVRVGNKFIPTKGFFNAYCNEESNLIFSSPRFNLTKGTKSVVDMLEVSPYHGREFMEHFGGFTLEGTTWVSGKDKKPLDVALEEWMPKEYIDLLKPPFEEYLKTRHELARAKKASDPAEQRRMLHELALRGELTEAATAGMDELSTDVKAKLLSLTEEEREEVFNGVQRSLPYLIATLLEQCKKRKAENTAEGAVPITAAPPSGAPVVHGFVVHQRRDVGSTEVLAEARPEADRPVPSKSTPGV